MWQGEPPSLQTGRSVSISFLLATLNWDFFCFWCNVAVIIICRERHYAVRMIRFCSRCAVIARCCCSKGNSPTFEILTLDLMKAQGLVVGRVASPCFSKDRGAFIFRVNLTAWLWRQYSRSKRRELLDKRLISEDWSLHTKRCWCISLLNTLRRLLEKTLILSVCGRQHENSWSVIWSTEKKLEQQSQYHIFMNLIRTSFCRFLKRKNSSRF